MESQTKRKKSSILCALHSKIVFKQRTTDEQKRESFDKGQTETVNRWFGKTQWCFLYTIALTYSINNKTYSVKKQFLLLNHLSLLVLHPLT